MKVLIQGVAALGKKVVQGKVAVIGVGLVLMVAVPVIAWAAFLWSYQGKILPGVRVGRVAISGMRVDEAEKALSEKETEFLDAVQIGVFWLENKERKDLGLVPIERLAVAYRPDLEVRDAFLHARSGSILENLKVLVGGWRDERVLEHEVVFKETELNRFMEDVAALVESPGVRARLVVTDTGGVEFVQGEDGTVVEKERLRKLVEERLVRLENLEIEVPVIGDEFLVSEDKGRRAVERALSLMNKKLVVRVDGEQELVFGFAGEELVELVDFEGGFRTSRVEELIGSLAEGVNREAVNAQFKFEGGRVVEFAASVEGLVIDEEQSSVALVRALNALERSSNDQVSSQLLVRRIAPAVETPEVNDLGIRELLGKGMSNYRGSVAGRVHNVALTASRLHGIIIEPGEVFSFNGTIGDVSRATGFASAYIIKDGRTVLGDGGGVCQDSTTLFRAVLDAGLPVVERRGHSYRVSYYEQDSDPGFDATVYAPVVDFKFKNDTPEHVLIQAEADTDRQTLTVELYGTNDGRVAQISNYQIWDRVPAPPALYQDDPTLAPGEVRQVDFAAAGAKVKFDYVVTRDGEVLIDKSFTTNYRPWQAVYLRGV